MKLIFIYGPPAAGKLTVAQALAELTDFRVFHNHLAIELANEVLSRGTPGYGPLVCKLRLSVIEAAATAGVSTIFTYVYEAIADDPFVDDVVRAVEARGGEVCFVQLVPSPEALAERVEQPSRETFSKIKTWAFLKELIERHEVYAPVRYENHLALDNSKIEPEAVAEMVADRFRLLDQP